MSKLNWKKVIGWAVAALVVIGVVGTNMYNLQSEKKENELIVAVNIPLSGPIAVFSGPYAKGLEMGVKDELKAQNLPENSVRFLMGDNQGQAMTAATLLKQQELNDYDVYIAGTSEMASAVVDSVNHERPFIIVAMDENMTLKYNNNLRVFANGSLMVDNLYKLIENKKPKKVSVIMGCPSGQKIADEKTIPFLKSKGIDYKKEYFEFGFREFRSVALKVKEYQPDLILMHMYSSELERMISALREYDLIKDENTYASIDAVDLIEAKNQKVLKDIIFDMTEYTKNQDKEFVESYQQKYHNEPTYGAAYGYDLGRLIVKAWVKSGKVTPETIIAQTPYDGVTGHLVMNPKTRDLISTQILGTLDKDGKVIEWKGE